MYEHMKLGTELTQSEQREVLAAYVQRFTRQHKPAWSRKEWKDGKPYPVQFDSDEDWLAHTSFRVTAKGALHKGRNDCQSSPTWPDNPELRK